MKYSNEQLTETINIYIEVCKENITNCTFCPFFSPSNRRCIFEMDTTNLDTVETPEPVFHVIP